MRRGALFALIESEISMSKREALMKIFVTIIGLMLVLSNTSIGDDRSLKNPNPDQFRNKTDLLTPTPAIAPKASSMSIDKNDKTVADPRKLILMGGATSGGGDDTGIEVQRVLNSVYQMIANSSDLYPEEVKQALLKKARTAKIMVTDNELPVTQGQFAQYGAAFSVYDEQEAIIQIQRKRWNDIANPLITDSLLHHELAVLAGVEITGDYQYTNKFAISRDKFWQSVLAKQFVCTFNLYGRAEPPSYSRPVTREFRIGKLLGSAGVTVGFDGSRSGFDVIQDLSPQVDGQYNKVVMVSYVISSNGYLRAQLSEADVSRYKNNDWKIFSNQTKVSQEKVYLNPYDYIDGARSASIEHWDDKLVQISCSKL